MKSLIMSVQIFSADEMDNVYRWVVRDGRVVIRGETDEGKMEALKRGMEAARVSFNSQQIAQEKPS